MVKRCAFGICNSDDRYPERVEGVVFIPFPKPKTNLERCLRWIKLCNRPHFQLNVDKINKNSFVCSKHFHDDKGPTPLYPDPLPASPCVNECDRTPLTPIRQPPKRRKLSLETPPRSASTNEDLLKASQNDSEIQDHPTSTVIQNKDTTAACQTEGKSKASKDVSRVFPISSTSEDTTNTPAMNPALDLNIDPNKRNRSLAPLPTKIKSNHDAENNGEVLDDQEGVEQNVIVKRKKRKKKNKKPGNAESNDKKPPISVDEEQSESGVQK